MNQMWTQIIFHKESITFLIALCGFTLSIYNFVRSLIHDHVKIKVTYKNHLCSSTCQNYAIIMMNIENCSRLPLSISRMFLEIGNDTYEFSSMPQFAYRRTRRTGDVVYDDITTHTLELPQSISTLGIIGGFFHVVGNITSERLLNEKVFISLWTTRGKRKYQIVMNNEVSHPS